MGDMQGTMVPASSRVVIIGGGVIGCSIAYQLAVRGVDGVTVVERRGLTDGSTWHAAGLVGQLRSSASLTQLMAKSVEIYDRLERDTGYATGWRPVGSLRVASSRDRWQEIRRLATAGKSFGFDVHLVSPAEAKELFPFLDIAGVHGATFVPSDGYIDPSQLTHAFAGGARAAGVRIVQHCRVEALERVGRRVTAVVTGQGRIECETVVNATGMWGAETARLAGVDVAVNAVEHQYVVTGKAAEASLERAHITANKNAIPFDPAKPAITSGIRLGTPAATSRGFGTEEFRIIGQYIVAVLDGLSASNDGSNDAVEAEIGAKVQELCARFPIYR